MRLPTLILAAAILIPGATTAADTSNCIALDRELAAAGVDPMTRLNTQQACIGQQQIDQELFNQGLRDLREGARAWQRPVYTPPRAIYCIPQPNGAFVCQ